jgi:hypothetical protein
MTAAAEQIATNGNGAQHAALPATRPARSEIMIVQDDSDFANLLDTARFEHIWRVAKVFAGSGMVPKLYAGKPEACFVATQMAVRLKVDPFMFMQNTYPSPDGKPAMEGKLAIALINARGPFKGGVQYKFSGEGETRACTAWGIHRDDDQPRELTISLATVKAEGWYSRNKKWQTMQDQMFRYRSGAWLGRAYCPEVLMGMQTAEEAEDRGILRQRGDGTYVPADPEPQQTPVTAAALLEQAGDGAEEAEPFTLTTADGEEVTAPDAELWARGFTTEMTKATTGDQLDRIWDANSPLLSRLDADRAEALRDDYKQFTTNLAAAAQQKGKAGRKAEPVGGLV